MSFSMPAMVLAQHTPCTTHSTQMPPAVHRRASTAVLRPPQRLSHPPRCPPPRALTPDLEPGVVAAYGTLGASAVGFVGTFAVAPRFREQFKEDLDWREIYAALVQQGGVRTVTASDAYRQTSSGKAVLLDVRMARKYEQGHAANAVNVPLYNPISRWDIPSIIRRAESFAVQPNQQVGHPQHHQTCRVCVLRHLWDGIEP